MLKIESILNENKRNYIIIYKVENFLLVSINDLRNLSDKKTNEKINSKKQKNKNEIYGRKS